MRTTIYVQIALVVGCNQQPATPSAVSVSDSGSAPASDSARVSVSDSASDSATGSVPASVSDSGSVSVVVPIVPPVPPLEKGGMMDHAQFYGFSDDGATLGYCAILGGKPIAECVMMKNGKVTSETHDGETGPANTMAVKAKALGIGKKRENVWPYDDLEITWSTTLGDSTTTPPKPGSLHVGLRKKGEPVSWLLDLSDRPYLDRWHPEFIGLSPDGATLGVIGHGFVSEYSDTFVIRTIAVNVAAARAYNDAGFAHHKKGDYATSVQLFRRAIDVDPTHPLARYNYACALARLHDPRTKDALSDAISKDATVKARAQKDADFDAVRAKLWFAALLTP